MCPPKPQKQSGLASSRYGNTENTYGSFQATIPETLRPNKPEQDINVMYLNIYGYPRGNAPATAQYLKNTKTLAITTLRNTKANSTPGEVLVGLVSPDGNAKEMMGNII